jgi:predicted nuclease of predicted toxin-antitoxin system
MKKFLVDANLPSKIKVWQNAEFEFVNQINDQWTDSEIWDYAKQNNIGLCPPLRRQKSFTEKSAI